MLNIVISCLEHSVYTVGEQWVPCTLPRQRDAGTVANSVCSFNMVLMVCTSTNNVTIVLHLYYQQ